MHQGTQDFLDARGAELRGKVLVFFSPPFPLNPKKKYGNRTGGPARWAPTRSRCFQIRP